MILLVSGASVDVAKAPPDSVGVLLQPGGRTRVELLRDRPWAVDNGGYGGFDEAAFVRRLNQLPDPRGCLFVVSPDVVSDWPATLQNFRFWNGRLRRMGWPVAIAAQDGARARSVPWASIDAIFIGGSTEWKLSRDADSILGYAAAMGKWRHVGRVNSRRRMRHFFGRCDSIDGSGFSRFPKRIWKALEWRRELQQQGELWRG